MKKLYLVSTGPGSDALLPPRARSAIEHSSDIVAYGLYMSLLADLMNAKTQHDLPLGEETGRATLALNLAASGKTTALLSSGDIGIFAMATLVFELLDNQVNSATTLPTQAGWLDVDIEVIPGISAMQANASLAGALLGHDFCAISLSDLLTPWEMIEKRLHAAGAGDFVISFYNPVSKKRDWQLNSARDILLQYRSPSTVVVLGHHLERQRQQQQIIALSELNNELVDMFTCVTVGNSETRHIQYNDKNWVYTPRGYSAKSNTPTGN